MANKPFDRTIINPRERPISADINAAQTQLDLSTKAMMWQSLNRRSITGTPSYEITQQDLMAAATAGFMGNSFRVNASAVPALSVTVEKGLGWYNANSTDVSIGGIVGVDDPDILRPLWNPSKITIAPIPAADLTLPRIDIVEVRVDRNVGDPTSRDILNIGTGVFAPGSVNKTLSYGMTASSINGSSSINYKTGVPNASPVVPSASAGYVKIAEIYVDALVSTISQLRVNDTRVLLFPGNAGSMSCIYSCSAAPGSMVSLAGTAGLNMAGNYGGVGVGQVDYYLSCGDPTNTVLSAAFALPNFAISLAAFQAIVTLSAAQVALLNTGGATGASPLVQFGQNQKVWKVTIIASTTLLGQAVGATFSLSRFA